MTPENFCYWLQGRTEGRDIVPPSPADWQIILDHLKIVFKKETPEYKFPLPVKVDPNMKPGDWRFETMPQYHDLFKPRPRENNLPGIGPAYCSAGTNDTFTPFIC